MERIIKDFPKQFEYEPEIVNSDKLKSKKKIIIAGMGGSHLAGGILKMAKPGLKIIVHSNYGLPNVSDDDLAESLVIASSYSGNTEETIDAFNTALGRGLDLAVVATGGKLLELAKQNGVPCIQMPPESGFPPRMALGYSLKAILKLVGDENLEAQAAGLAGSLNVDDARNKGKALAKKLENKVPVIYSSKLNIPLAYVWKINFNETSKIPAFYNFFPEMNHNEMQGFEAKSLPKNFHLIFIKDKSDDPRILKRMDLTQKVLKEEGIEIDVLELGVEPVFHKIFSSIITAYWAGYYLSRFYGVEAENAPLIEKFKKLL
jgi:glucose/mannose-6-phosphate isomerase